MAEAPTASPYPAGDPRNTLYGETITGLRHQYETTLSNYNFEEGQEKGNTEYGQSQITKAEPGAFRGEEGKFNKAGLLTSGIYSRERGGLESQFAAKHYALTHREQENVEKRNRAREAAKYNLGAREGGALTKAEVEGYKETLANPPTATPAPTAQQNLAKAPPGPSGKYPVAKPPNPAKAQPVAPKTYLPPTYKGYLANPALRRTAARKVVK